MIMGGLGRRPARACSEASKVLSFMFPQAFEQLRSALSMTSFTFDASS